MTLRGAACFRLRQRLFVPAARSSRAAAPRAPAEPYIVFSGAGIARFVKARVPKRTIEELNTRFAAIATDLGSGELVLLDRGELGRAVQASSSLPGLFEPVRIGRRLCVDGNLSAPVPVTVARTLGAMRVIAVDITFPPVEASLGNAIDALYQGFPFSPDGSRWRTVKGWM